MPYLPYNPRPKPPPPYVPPPPSMVILAPTSGQQLSDNTPTIRGTATGTSTVTVVVKQGSSTVQTLTATPSGGVWTVTAATLADNSYTATATQTVSGSVVTAGPVAFSVLVSTPPPPPPVVKILAPAAGSTVQDDTPPIVGSATGNTTVTVVIKKAGVTVQTLTAPAPSGGTWLAPNPASLPDGVYTIDASQTMSGLTGNATPVTFTVDAPQPAVVISSVDGKPPGSSTTNTTPTIVGTGQNRTGDDTTVTVTIVQGATTIQSSSRTLAGTSWSWTPTALPVGSYVVRATQGSTFGTGSSGDFAFSVTAAQALPAPTITTPTEGQSLASNPVSFSGTAGTASGDATLLTLRVYTSTSNTPTHSQSFNRTGGTWSTQLTLSLTSGSWRARIEQVGTAGTGASAFRSFVVSIPTPPTAGFAMPRGPVSGFAQAADFYDTVGFVHLPNNFTDPNPAATSIDTAIARLQELGVRHVRMGIYSPANHTDWNYHYKTQQFLIREQTLRGSNQPIFANYGLGLENAQSTVKRSYTATDGTGMRVLDGPSGQITANTNWTTESDMPPGGGLKYVPGWFYTPGWGTVASIQLPNEPNTRSHTANGAGSIRELAQKEKAAKNARTNTVLGGQSYIDSNTGRIVAGPAKANQIPIVGFALTSAAVWPEFGDYTQAPDVDVACMHVYFGGVEPRVNNVWGRSQTTSLVYTSTGYNGFLGTGTRTFPLPYMVTETGYLQRTGTNDGGTTHCPEEVAGEYLIRTLLHNYLFGNCRRTFIFSLTDAAEGAVTGGGRFGIMDDSFNRRASFYAIKNLMTLVGFRQGSFSTPVTTVTSGFTPGAENLHTENGGGRGNGSSPDRLNEMWLQLDDNTYIKFLQRDRMLWDRGSQAYKTVTDPQTVTLPLPSGTWTCGIAEPAKNPVLDPDDGQSYANPGNGTAYAAPGVSGNGFTQSGNTLSVRLAGLTRVVKITKASGDALSRRVVSELDQFANWCTSNSVQGAVTEFGVPTNTHAGGVVAADTDEWAGLLETYYKRLQATLLWSLQWVASEVPVGELSTYLSPAYNSPLNEAMAAAAPLEAHAGDGFVRRGIALTGLEFGTETPPLALGFNSSKTPEQMGPAIDEWQAQVGAPPAMAMYYGDWYEGWSTAIINPPFTSPATARGVIPLITWEPCVGAAINQPAYTLARIAAGDHDAYVQRAAREVKAFGLPVFIRFAHEMNGNWSSWDRGQAGNTPAGYIAAWRHVVQVFRNEGVTNALWMWSPNVSTGTTSIPPFAPYYPGDAWVDWVALDGYNSTGTNMTLAQVFQSSYNAMVALTNKPMIIGETACAQGAANKAGWITTGLGQTVPNTFPNIRGVVWFDRLKEDDWRVASSPASLAAFRAVVATGLYDGTAEELLAPRSSGAFSNTNPGALNSSYYAATQGSWTWLRSRGTKIARVGFKWERLQPTLGGALNGTYLQNIKDQVARAKVAGVDVVLDCHNFGRYITSASVGAGGLALGSAGLTSAHFNDLWVRLAQVFGPDPSVVGYEIMNGPHDLPGGNSGWQTLSQSCVNAIRGVDTSTEIWVAGHNWSKVQGWATTHPAPWITGSGIRYVGRHYFDSESSGGSAADSVYQQTYASAVADAVAAGF